MDKEFLKITELDSLTFDPHMQMLKAALPYIHIPEQRFFSLLVKCSELERTLQLFEENNGAAIGICSLDEAGSGTPIDMLTAMKPYATEYEQDFIDVIINVMQGNRLARAGAASDDNSLLDRLKTLLSPEQQTRLETMQLLLQAFRTDTPQSAHSA